MRQRPEFYAPDDRPSFNTTPRPMLVESCVERDQLGETEMHQHASLEQEWGHRYHVSRMDFFYPNGWIKGKLVTYKCRDSLKQLRRGQAAPRNGNKKPRKIVRYKRTLLLAWTTCTSCFWKIIPIRFFIFAKPERIWMQSFVFDLPQQDFISEVQGGTSCICDLR